MQANHNPGNRMTTLNVVTTTTEAVSPPPRKYLTDGPVACGGFSCCPSGNGGGPGGENMQIVPARGMPWSTDVVQNKPAPLMRALPYAQYHERAPHMNPIIEPVDSPKHPSRTASKNAIKPTVNSRNALDDKKRMFFEHFQMSQQSESPSSNRFASGRGPASGGSEQRVHNSTNPLHSHFGNTQSTPGYGSRQSGSGNRSASVRSRGHPYYQTMHPDSPAQGSRSPSTARRPSLPDPEPPVQLEPSDRHRKVITGRPVSPVRTQGDSRPVNTTNSVHIYDPVTGREIRNETPSRRRAGNHEQGSNDRCASTGSAYFNYDGPKPAGLQGTELDPRFSARNTPVRMSMSNRPSGRRDFNPATASTQQFGAGASFQPAPTFNTEGNFKPAPSSGAGMDAYNRESRAPDYVPVPAAPEKPVEERNDPTSSAIVPRMPDKNDSNCRALVLCGAPRRSPERQREESIHRAIEPPAATPPPSAGFRGPAEEAPVSRVSSAADSLRRRMVMQNKQNGVAILENDERVAETVRTRADEQERLQRVNESAVPVPEPKEKKSGWRCCGGSKKQKSRPPRFAANYKSGGRPSRPPSTRRSTQSRF